MDLLGYRVIGFMINHCVFNVSNSFKPEVNVHNINAKINALDRTIHKFFISSSVTDSLDVSALFM